MEQVAFTRVMSSVRYITITRVMFSFLAVWRLATRALPFFTGVRRQGADTGACAPLRLPFLSLQSRSFRLPDQVCAPIVSVSTSGVSGYHRLPPTIVGPPFKTIEPTDHAGAAARPTLQA